MSGFIALLIPLGIGHSNLVMENVRLNDIVYLNSGSPKLLVIGLLDEVALLKTLPDGEEFNVPIACLSYINNKEWLEQNSEFIVH